jgi:hypothetical protein
LSAYIVFHAHCTHLCGPPCLVGWSWWCSLYLHIHVLFALYFLGIEHSRFVQLVNFLLIYNFKFIIWYTNMLFAYHTFLYFIMYLKIHNKIRIMIQQIRIMILDLSQWSTFKNRQGNLFVWSHGFLYLIMYLKIYNKVRFMIQQISIMIPNSSPQSIVKNSQGNSYFRTESR